MVAEAKRKAAAKTQEKKDRARKWREEDTARAQAALYAPKKKRSIRTANISAVRCTRTKQDKAAAKKRRTDEELR